MFVDDSPNEDFRIEIQKAINNDDVNKVTDLLYSMNYPGVIKTDKEKMIFSSSSIAFKHYSKAEDILKYLIFEYKININIYINIPFIKDERIEKMFTMRKDIEELKSDLIVNHNLTHKSLKV